MDPIRNPFGPGAGMPPPALVGRRALLDAFDVTLARAHAGRPVRSLLATGLRGVGKTVLLNRFETTARHAGFRVGFLEASDDGSFLTSLAGRVRQVILELDRLGSLSEAAKRAMRVFKSFTLRLGAEGSCKRRLLRPAEPGLSIVLPAPPFMPIRRPASWRR